MSEFNITYVEVEQIYSGLKTHANRMQSILEDVTSKISAVHNDAWQSAAAQTHQEEFNRIKAKFQNFYGEVIKCAEYLKKVVDTNKATDQAIDTAIQ